MRKEVLALGALTLSLAACGGGSDPGTEVMGETATETTEKSTDEVAEAASQTPMQAPVSAPADPIRGQGGLEEKCLARVNDTVGGGVIGTNRIEESEAAIEIYVNVDGAQAPWKCLGYKDGTIAEVMYTGSEGAL